MQKDRETEEDKIEQVVVPEVRELNLVEATKALKELGLKIETNVEIKEEMNKEEIIIKEQTPKPGIKVNKGSKITVEI